VARAQQTEWENSLDWKAIGPKMLAALEDIDFALSCAERPSREARKIIKKIFKEIGRDKLDE
jgi:hypothetical protein